jgi:hypothetical protein
VPIFTRLLRPRSATLRPLRPSRSRGGASSRTAPSTSPSWAPGHSRRNPWLLCGSAGRSIRTASRGTSGVVWGSMSTPVRGSASSRGAKLLRRAARSISRRATPSGPPTHRRWAPLTRRHGNRRRRATIPPVYSWTSLRLQDHGAPCPGPTATGASQRGGGGATHAVARVDVMALGAVCGDGVVDPVLETCDDGGVLGGDG